MRLIPDFDFEFQFGIELFFDPFFYSVYESQNVTAFALVVGDYEISVFFTYGGASDLQALQAGPVDQGAGGDTSWVFEYAAGIFRI